MNRYNKPHFNRISTATQRRQAVDIDYQWERTKKIARLPFMFFDEIHGSSTADDDRLYENMVRRFISKGNHIPDGAQIVVLSDRKY